jgi:hypothetical protein
MAAGRWWFEMARARVNATRADIIRLNVSR